MSFRATNELSRGERIFEFSSRSLTGAGVTSIVVAMASIFSGMFLNQAIALTFLWVGGAAVLIGGTMLWWEGSDAPPLTRRRARGASAFALMVAAVFAIGAVYGFLAEKRSDLVQEGHIQFEYVYYLILVAVFSGAALFAYYCGWEKE